MLRARGHQEKWRKRLALSKFTQISGLMVNVEKSSVFSFSAVDTHTRSQILQLVGFKEKKFPVRYRGIPIITPKLKKADCQKLVDQVGGKLDS